jgi:putative photosynthetic complex assembly protein 2
VGFFDTLTNDSVAGVYMAFLSALALWGWIELAFLTGVITGPVNQPLPDGSPRNGSGSSAPGAPSPITRCCWPSR